MEKWQEIGMVLLGLVVAAWSVGDWVQVQRLRTYGIETEAHLKFKTQESRTGRGLAFWHNYLIFTNSRRPEK